MKTVDDYMDAARSRLALPSDRALSKALGVGFTAPNQWRTRRAWPADDTMVRLAELAGADPAQALLDLNQWRNQSPAVRSVYERIAARIAATAASVIIAFGVAGYGTAKADGARVAVTVTDAVVYYGKSRG